MVSNFPLACWFGDMVFISPLRVSGDRARSPPKLKGDGTIDKGNNTSSCAVDRNPV